MDFNTAQGQYDYLLGREPTDERGLEHRDTRIQNTWQNIERLMRKMESDEISDEQRERLGELVLQKYESYLDQIDQTNRFVDSWNTWRDELAEAEDAMQAAWRRQSDADAMARGAQAAAAAADIGEFGYQAGYEQDFDPTMGYTTDDVVADRYEAWNRDVRLRNAEIERENEQIERELDRQARDIGEFGYQAGYEQDFDPTMGYTTDDVVADRYEAWNRDVRLRNAEIERENEEIERELDRQARDIGEFGYQAGYEQDFDPTMGYTTDDVVADRYDAWNRNVRLQNAQLDDDRILRLGRYSDYGDDALSDTGAGMALMSDEEIIAAQNQSWLERERNNPRMGLADAAGTPGVFSPARMQTWARQEEARREEAADRFDDRILRLGRYSDYGDDALSDTGAGMALMSDEEIIAAQNQSWLERERNNPRMGLADAAGTPGVFSPARMQTWAQQQPTAEERATQAAAQAQVDTWRGELMNNRMDLARLRAEADESDVPIHTAEIASLQGRILRLEDNLKYAEGVGEHDLNFMQRTLDRMGEKIEGVGATPEIDQSPWWRRVMGNVPMGGKYQALHDETLPDFMPVVHYLGDDDVGKVATRFDVGEVPGFGYAYNERGELRLNPDVALDAMSAGLDAGVGLAGQSRRTAIGAQASGMDIGVDMPQGEGFMSDYLYSYRQNRQSPLNPAGLTYELLSLPARPGIKGAKVALGYAGLRRAPRYLNRFQDTRVPVESVELLGVDSPREGVATFVDVSDLGFGGRRPRTRRLEEGEVVATPYSSLYNLSMNRDFRVVSGGGMARPFEADRFGIESNVGTASARNRFVEDPDVIPLSSYGLGFHNARAYEYAGEPTLRQNWKRFSRGEETLKPSTIQAPARMGETLQSPFASRIDPEYNIAAANSFRARAAVAGMSPLQRQMLLDTRTKAELGPELYKALQVATGQIYQNRALSGRSFLRPEGTIGNRARTAVKRAAMPISQGMYGAAVMFGQGQGIMPHETQAIHYSISSPAQTSIERRVAASEWDVFGKPAEIETEREASAEAGAESEQTQETTGASETVARHSLSFDRIFAMDEQAQEEAQREYGDVSAAQELARQSERESMRDRLDREAAREREQQRQSAERQATESAALGLEAIENVNAVESENELSAELSQEQAQEEAQRDHSDVNAAQEFARQTGRESMRDRLGRETAQEQTRETAQEQTRETAQEQTRETAQEQTRETAQEIEQSQVAISPIEALRQEQLNQIQQQQQQQQDARDFLEEKIERENEILDPPPRRRHFDMNLPDDDDDGKNKNRVKDADHLHPSEVEWEEHDLEHELDLHTGQERTRKIKSTGRSPQETIRVSGYSDDPAPHRVIDLPGSVDAVATPKGVELVNTNLAAAVDRDMALVGGGGLRTRGAARKSGQKRQKQSRSQGNGFARQAQRPRKKPRGRMFSAMTR